MAAKTRMRGEQGLCVADIESGDQVFHNHSWWVVEDMVEVEDGYHQLLLSRNRSRRSATTTDPWVRDDAKLRTLKAT